MPKDISVALPYQNEESISSHLFEPDVILPSQYFDMVQGRGSLTPEKKLMLAVLESAVHDFQRYRLAKGIRGRRLFREAQEWLTSREGTGVFSFAVICQALGIDPDYIRKGLFRQSSEKEGRKSRWW
jgi:hypothetical protein